MKRYHLLVAAILVLPVFFSCGGKNHTPDDPTPTPAPTPTPTPTPPPTPVDPTPTPTPEPDPIEFRRTVRFDHNIISMNSSKDFIAVFEESLVTKSPDSRKILTGSYTFSDSDNIYTLKDFGKLEIIDDKQVAFTPSGGTRKVYDAETTVIVDAEESNSYYLNRSWTINESILKFRGANYSFDGLDLNEVEKIARGQGIEFKYHMDDGMVAKKLIVTDALVAAEFKNGESYAAEHTLRSSTKYDKKESFKLDEFTNDLKGDATVQFEKDGEDLWCYITITTTLDQSPAEVVFTLKEMK